MLSFYKKYSLKFKESAKTSRDTLFFKDTYFLHYKKDGVTGIGECSFIKGLSLDNPNYFEHKLNQLCQNINNPECVDIFDYPGIAFGLETAINDWKHGGKRIIFNNNFHKGKIEIPINGLIWMSNFVNMKKQVHAKIKQGFSCIKIKIGQHSFEDELRFVLSVRKEHPDIEIRLDANGAFESKEAANKLERLSIAGIHSVEQPIKAGLWDDMAEICEKSSIKIALDEELIGISDFEKRSLLIKTIKPSFIVLKPSLLGGFNSCDKWIEIAESKNIGWWVTSALESNIGLNAIAQWLCEKEIKTFQGLGTGLLFSNNIPSPLKIKNSSLYYDNCSSWNIAYTSH